MAVLDRDNFFNHFNPHHHAGGDDNYRLIEAAKVNFNPHHHAGGDSFKETERTRTWISIHTTTQVVTHPGRHLGYDCKISIHTTTQVVTLYLWTVFCCNTYFNPHHHAGGDYCPSDDDVRKLLFQSTPPRRW